MKPDLTISFAYLSINIKPLPCACHWAGHQELRQTDVLSVPQRLSKDTVTFKSNGFLYVE